MDRFIGELIDYGWTDRSLNRRMGTWIETDGQTS